MTRKSRKPALNHRLGDGTLVSLRPIGPDDKPLLEEGMARLSPQSKRLRFMAPVESLSRAQLVYLTEIDHRDHIAWGVLHDEQPVAVARIVRIHDDPKSAELAVTVIDDFQRRGIARLLITVMAELARNLGIERFVFEALPENDALLALLRGFGASYEMTGGVVSGSVSVNRIPAPVLEGDPLSLGIKAQQTAGISP
jgi:RimJ/RimL family protein N-acetyltransferase